MGSAHRHLPNRRLSGRSDATGLERTEGTEREGMPAPPEARESPCSAPRSQSVGLCGCRRPRFPFPPPHPSPTPPVTGAEQGPAGSEAGALRIASGGVGGGRTLAWLRRSGDGWRNMGRVCETHVWNILRPVHLGDKRGARVDFPRQDTVTVHYVAQDRLLIFNLIRMDGD
ncbi:hypothetical protein AAFF_G00007080 [Aldrovandia affinis]|uniref:Uncharacterized protein n=1 Tax=Aldrovandia affinis TaxID=143900 RepID=A0AAD7T624_9TELE|nr:hypothetical protein AAFF_G00007080 [Aldrovandia affinis]